MRVRVFPTKATQSDEILHGLFRADCAWMVLERSRLQVHGFNVCLEQSNQSLAYAVRFIRLMMWTQTPNLSYMGLVLANAAEDIASWSSMQCHCSN